MNTETSSQPIQFLTELFQSRKERNSAYSLRAFARDLGISPSLMSRLFSGERPFSLKLGMQISTVLGLSEAESKRLLVSILKKSSKSAKISKKMRERLEKETVATDTASASTFTTVEIEQFKAMAQWYHLAILNLVKTKKFQSNPSWIASQLGIATFEVREAIDRLIALGLLKEEGDKLVRAQKSLFIKTSKSEVAIRKFHSQMIAKAQDELQKTSVDDFSNRLINGITITCSPEHIEVIKDKIDKFQDEIFNVVKDTQNDHVYQMNVQFFPLTPVSNTSKGEVP